MNFRDRVRSIFDKSFETSKELFHKASDTAKNLSEKSVLHLEIRELENRKKKEFIRLGNKVYDHFSTENNTSLSIKNSEFTAIFEEIAHIEAEITKRESSLSTK